MCSNTPTCSSPLSFFSSLTYPLLSFQQQLGEMNTQYYVIGEKAKGLNLLMTITKKLLMAWYCSRLPSFQRFVDFQIWLKNKARALRLRLCTDGLMDEREKRMSSLSPFSQRHRESETERNRGRVMGCAGCSSDLNKLTHCACQKAFWEL